MIICLSIICNSLIHDRFSSTISAIILTVINISAFLMTLAPACFYYSLILVTDVELDRNFSVLYHFVTHSLWGTYIEI